MSKHREIDDRLHTLREITGIFGAMKNFALMETQKLTRVLPTQQRVLDSIDAVVTDFLTFYPAGTQRIDRGKRVYLLFGSERGLCGDFNEALLDRFAQAVQGESEESYELICVGSKLAEKLERDARIVATVPGPTVTEEVQPVLIRLMDTVREAQVRRNSKVPLDLTIVHYRAGAEDAHIEVRRPFHPAARATARYAYPPVLYLDPLMFMTALFDFYLLSILHEVCFSSLMAENQRRFQHMDQAVRRLQRDIEELTLKRNRWRQEEITEEIEVIMLSADVVKAPSAH